MCTYLILLICINLKPIKDIWIGEVEEELTDLLQSKVDIEDIEIIPNDKVINIKLAGTANVSIYEGEKLLVSERMTDCYSYKPERPILWNAEQPYLYTVVVEQAVYFIPFKIVNNL